MRKLVVSFLVCLLLFSTSCEKEEVTTSTMKLKSNGSINSYIIELFDKTKYQEVDLKNWVTLEINNYNDGKEDKVVLKDLYVEEGKALLSVNYPTYNDYMELNDEVLFFGTVEEVMGPEFCLIGDYLDAEGSKTIITEDILLENLDWKVFIVKDAIRVKTYTNASFYTPNIKKISRKTYDLLEYENQESNDEEYYILIFE
jgi:hypothetical protein